MQGVEGMLCLFWLRPPMAARFRIRSLAIVLLHTLTGEEDSIFRGVESIRSKGSSAL